MPAADDPKALFPAIEKMVKTHVVVLYMKGTPAQPMCGFSAQVVRILHQHGAFCASTPPHPHPSSPYPRPPPPAPRTGADIHGVNILEEGALRVAMKEFSSWPTFPQLYVKGEFVGGCDIVTAMHTSGELKTLLAKA